MDVARDDADHKVGLRQMPLLVEQLAQHVLRETRRDPRVLYKFTCE